MLALQKQAFDAKVAVVDRLLLNIFFCGEAQYLLQLLPCYQNLRVFHLNAAPLSHAQGEKLMQQLSAARRLKTVFIRWVTLSPNAVAALCRACRQGNLQLEVLHLRCGRLGDAAMVPLAEALAASVSWKQLNLFLYYIGRSGARVLAALRTNTTLMELELAGNWIGNAGAAALAAALASNDMLKKVDLDYCFIGLAGARALADLPRWQSRALEIRCSPTSMHDLSIRQACKTCACSVFVNILVYLFTTVCFEGYALFVQRWRLYVFLDRLGYCPSRRAPTSSSEASPGTAADF